MIKQTMINNIDWKKLFDKYDVLEHINKSGKFIMSAPQIKEFGKNFLMSDINYSMNLPKIFSDNGLSILPITRDDYIISNFNAYHKLESQTDDIIHVSIPKHIQSLNINKIDNEMLALNCALAAGIISNFVEDENIKQTFSGFIKSDEFNFKINDLKNNSFIDIKVENLQWEMGAAYEGIKNLTLFEVSLELPEDFLIAHLYYPYRIWLNKITKNIKTVFMIYSNGIYHLYEYKFKDVNNYNSIELVKQQNYSIED